jgi:hypothetical protein
VKPTFEGAIECQVQPRLSQVIPDLTRASSGSTLQKEELCWLASSSQKLPINQPFNRTGDLPAGRRVNHLCMCVGKIQIKNRFFLTTSRVRQVNDGDGSCSGASKREILRKVDVQPFAHQQFSPPQVTESAQRLFGTQPARTGRQW